MEAGKCIIALDHITKKYGHLAAVDDFSLEINKNEILGFLGPNGAGKSTTINIICGLIKPTKGSVYYYGQLLSASIKKEIKIGLCPQEIIIWPKLTCLEQLVFVGNIYGLTNNKSKQRGVYLLERLGLTEKINKLASTLSGGMKRRLNLALALVHDPDIIILDEPEAGLDPQSRILVREFIKEISKDKTVILTSHNMDEVDRLAERIAIIDNGKLLKYDTPENLKKSIGDGDIFEIGLKENSLSLKELKIIFKSISERINLINSTLTFQSINMLEQIPEICKVLEKHNIGYGEIKLRSNTLEDVFIHLTGRRLRE